MSQLIIPYKKSSSYKYDDFIVSKCNEIAYSNLINWKKLFGVNPYPQTLLLVGPKSSGKTYLTKIWQYLTKAANINLGKDFSKYKFNTTQAFIIEDIDRFKKKGKNLLHYFNKINEEKKYLLLTSSSTRYNFEINDLISRLNSIKQIIITPPDKNLIELLIFKTFAELSLKPSSEVIHFLVNRLPNDFSNIVKSIYAINNQALIAKRNITIPLIKETINLLL